MPFGAYALLKSLGQGAMGDIHLARPYNVRRGIPTPIVIKRLHGELASNPDFVRRFKHEAEIAVSVDSPHVAKVYDVGAVGETLYIAMEYVNGWPVSKFIEAVIASGHHANISAIVDLIAGGLRGLTALHEAKDVRTGQPLGVVHRDISPKNLMVGEDGAMRLIDLGLGKSNVQDWKTRTGVVMGSVGYMPPEQVTAEKIDHRADLYAMGAVLFELLALRHYIARGPIPVMLRRSVEPTFEPPSRFRPDVPRGLDEVLQKALELDANRRYQSAAEFLAAIRAVVPERKSAGGMMTLISELFSTSLPERKSELSQLLRLPLPELEEDGPEPEHTVTFVVAEGVAPLAPEDMPRTRVTNAGDVRVGPATARSPRAEIVPSLQQPMPMPQVYAQPEYVAPMAEGAAYTGIPPSASLPVPTTSNAVPMWVLGVAVVAALAVGAIVSIVFQGSDQEPAVLTVDGRDPRAPAAVPAAVPGAVGVTPSTPSPVAVPDAGVAPSIAAAPASPSATASPSGAPASPATSAPATLGRPAGGSSPAVSEAPASAPARPTRSAPPPSAPAAVPSPTTARTESVDSAADSVRELSQRLMQRATSALSETSDPAKQQEISQILTDITMDANSANPEQALPRLRAYEKRLQGLVPR